MHPEAAQARAPGDASAARAPSLRDDDTARARPSADTGRQLCCTMTAVVVQLVRGSGGEVAVRALLERAESRREVSYLESPENWVSLDEACALLAAGVHVTGDPCFARHVGEETLRQHSG